MAQEHRKESLMARDFTPGSGVDYILGLYVIGDIEADTQVESGVFLKGSSAKDLHLYEIDATEPVGGAIARIHDLVDLQSRVSGKSLTMYEGKQILLRDPDSNLAARYEPIPQEARADLLRTIQE
jgi:hypothetical protein